jgi:shikimate kinase
MNKIVITGFMGSGKSSVARALGQLLSYEVIDLDSVIEMDEGRSARAIIDEDGEPLFRELEERAVGKVLKTPGNAVIALGGGTWIFEANRKMIHEAQATSVWIDAPFELCWKRIAMTAEQRPLARTESAALKLYSERTSCYELADLHVAVADEESAQDVAGKIVNSLAQNKSSTGLANSTQLQ